MFRAHCCQKPLRFILQASLAAALCGTNLAAETFNYSADTRFSGETIRVVQQETTLARVLWMVSAQTGLQWDDLPLDLPLGSAVVLEPGSRVTLAQVFMGVSAQVPVVFIHRGDSLVVRLKRAEDVVVLPGQAAVPPATPGVGEAVAGLTPTETPALTPAAPAEPAQTPEAVPETPPFLGGLTLSGMTPVNTTPATTAKVIEDATITLEKFTLSERAGGKNSVIVERRQAIVATEVLSGSDFNKYIATDVADLSVRMPGISTTTKGTFAVVRGLAERYNPVMLDGIVLPSTDPERQSPELDLFPTRLVDAIVISKTYEPRLPGTASGAGIDLRAKPIPQGRFAQVQFGLKADEGFLKKEKFLGSNRVGVWDYFAYGVKDRAAATDLDKNNFAYVRSPNTVTNIRNGSFPLGGRFALTYEDRININTDTGSAFGYGISFGYDRSASTEEGETMTIRGGVLALTNNLVDGVNVPVASGAGNVGNLRTVPLDLSAKKYRESELETRFGLLTNLGFAFNDQHQLAFGAFWSQIGIDQHSEKTHVMKFDAISFADFGVARNADFNDQPTSAALLNLKPSPQNNETIELYYRQRQLYNFHLGGEHKFGTPLELKASWMLARIGASQQEPEFLSLEYNHSYVNVPERYTFMQAKSYTRYWRETKEASKIGRLDLEGKIDSLLGGLGFKVGTYTDRTGRDYRENSASVDFLNASAPEGLTRQAMIDGLASAIYSAVAFSSEKSPAYSKGTRTLDAAYASATLTVLKDRPWINRLDLLLGARQESFMLDSNGRGKVANEDSSTFYALYYGLKGDLAHVSTLIPGTTFAGHIDEKKVLPALALNYSLNKSLTFRMAASRTTARPSFREVGSYFTVDAIADEYIHGNRDLKTSDVSNLDFRVEYFFPKSKDLVALSVFRKKISNPIERISMVSIGNLSPLLMGPVSTFVNNENDANLRGMEFEFAKSLRFMGGPARWFSMGGNATLIEAKVKRHPLFEVTQILSTGIEDERSLFDQPRWIANANTTFDYKPLGFSTTLTYFAISEILQKVNVNTWDTYTAQRARWDLSMAQKFGNNWQLRFSVSNLADPDRKLVADPRNTNEEIVYRRYKDGRSYSLSVGHDF